MYVIAEVALTMQAITGDSVLSKFEKARCALEDSLRRVEDIVAQSIGSQVRFIFWWCVVIAYNTAILC